MVGRPTANKKIEVLLLPGAPYLVLERMIRWMTVLDSVHLAVVRSEEATGSLLCPCLYRKTSRLLHNTS